MNTLLEHVKNEELQCLSEADKVKEDSDVIDGLAATDGASMELLNNDANKHQEFPSKTSLSTSIGPTGDDTRGDALQDVQFVRKKLDQVLMRNEHDNRRIQSLTTALMNLRRKRLSLEKKIRNAKGNDTKNVNVRRPRRTLKK